jgi:beta-xylosidase
VNKQAFNPYLPQWEYVPDGEPHVFGERLYIYGSHDRFNGDRYCMNDYVCWSAPIENLSGWRYEGVIYRANQDPHNKDGNMRLFAPDVARGAGGEYYLYYALSSRNAISVAVSDSPNGKYEFLSDICYADGTVLGEKPGDRFQFDPAVLVDDDGTVYLYTGFSTELELQMEMKRRSDINVTSEGASVVVLEPDMKTVKIPPKPLVPGWQNAAGSGFEGREFFEASSIRKFDATYYFVYSSVLGHELCYATSKHPDRDFRFRGVLQ